MSPPAQAESAMRTWPLEPTGKMLGVEAAEAVIREPLAVSADLAMYAAAAPAGVTDRLVAVPVQV